MNRNTLLKILLLVPLLLAVGNFWSKTAEVNVACAAGAVPVQVNYSQPVTCTTNLPKECPAGNVTLHNGPGSTFYECLNISNNKFCELMTGRADVIFKEISADNPARHCAGKIKPGIGYCVAEGAKNLTLNLGSVPQEIYKYYAEIYGLKLAGAPDYRAINDKLINESECKYFHELDNVMHLRVPGGIDDEVHKANHTTASCLRVEGMYTDVPCQGVSTGPTNLSRQNSISQATELGLRLIRSVYSHPESFCSTRQSIDVQLSIANLTNPINFQKCYENIQLVGNMRPCMISDLPGGGGNVCVKGLTNFVGATTPSETGVYIYSNEGIQISIQQALSSFLPGVGTPSPDVYTNYWKYVQTGPEELCLKNGRDLMQERGNKGCSDFVTYNTDKNTYTIGDRYQTCLKCIYKNTDITADDITKGKESGISIANGTVIPGPINPDNEVFAEVKPGYIFTELGCINTSNTGSIINTIVTLALGIMGGLIILRIIQGALTMQQGDAENFEEGIEIIKAAIIGLLTLIFVTAILNFIGINILQLDKSGGFTPFG